MRLPRRTGTPRNRASLGAALRDVGGLSEVVGVSGVDAAALEIGQLIRRERFANGLTQIDLAKAVGIAQSALSNIELGKGNDGPSYRLLRNIAHALGKSFTPFFVRSPAGGPPDLVTFAGPSPGFSRYEVSVAGFIRGLLDQNEFTDVCAQVQTIISGYGRAYNMGELFQPTMCRVLPLAHTRLETHGLTVFLAVNGALRIESDQTLGAFDKGYIVAADKTIEVANPNPESLSFLSVPARCFLPILE
jgi:transcriptional regulator with XRE-family HTH domain